MCKSAWPCLVCLHCSARGGAARPPVVLTSNIICKEDLLDPLDADVIRGGTVLPVTVAAASRHTCLWLKAMSTACCAGVSQHWINRLVLLKFVLDAADSIHVSLFARQTQKGQGSDET